jgi:Aspartyl protease
MGRIRQAIEVDGSKFWTLFDSGARRTCITPAVARLLKTSPSPETFRPALGGTVRETNTHAVLDARIEGRPISTFAWVIDEIGRDEEGKDIEILFGALAMQEWGIRLIPDEERLDLTHYSKDFVEF